MLMLDNILEKVIKEHAEELFSSELLQGHRERFADKLSAAANVGQKRRFFLKGHCERPTGEIVASDSRKKTFNRRIISYASIAAVLAGCIFMLYRAYSMSYHQESESLSEVQNYYSVLLQDKIDDVEQLLQQIDENDRAALIKDIENMFEEADYAIRNSEEKNAGFVVTTYSAKIETLQHIQTMLSDNL